jgi:hypothetical protein
LSSTRNAVIVMEGLSIHATQQARNEQCVLSRPNAGSGRAETEQRCSTIEDVLEREGRACHLALVDDPSRLASIAAAMAARAAGISGVQVARR